jgi:uncharacterized protein (DUF58 family)
MLATTDPAGEGITWASHAELVALRRQLPRRLAAPVDRLHGGRAGVQASVLRGRGMDYRESRAYQPGDDVRRMDWRLTARSGRLHTKLFQEERERILWLVLDTHASMQFGTRRRFKSVQAARAAALAAWLGVATSMRVGLACFGPKRVTVAPRAGTHGALSVIHALARDPSQPKADGQEPESMSDALGRMMHMTHGGSQVLLVSDGDSTDAAVRAKLVALRRRAHVRLLLVNDALESELPPPGRYPLSWQGAVRSVDLVTGTARARFRQDIGRGALQLRQLARELGLPCRDIDTEAEPLSVVAALLGVSMQGRGS